MSKKQLEKEIDAYVKERQDLLDRVEPLNVELKAFLEPNPVLGLILRHPLVMSVPYHEGLNAVLNKQLEQKKARYKEHVDAKDWHGALFMIERPFRLTGFLIHRSEYSTQDFCELLTWVYTDSENPSVNRKTWIELFDEAKRRNQRALFDDEDYQEFEALDDELVVYRGCAKSELRKSRGVSWTLDKERAIWFAKRYKSQKKVALEARVLKKDVCFYTNGRNEREIVLNPRFLKNVKIALDNI